MGNNTFVYDEVGNREDTVDTQLWQYNANNQLTQGPDYTYLYDNDGNTVSKTKLASPQDTTTYTHDLINRLTQFSITATTANYQYEPGGRRISKDVDGTTTYFLWSGRQLIGEYNTAGARDKRYSYLPSSFAPSQLTDENGTYSVHTDHLDTPKLLTNSSETIVWRSVREAFGKMEVAENPDGDGNSVVMNFRFPGQYYDQESGLHYNYHRTYNPQLGRYIQADPIGLDAGVNPYLYIDANPLMFIDPFGLQRGLGGLGASAMGLGAEFLDKYHLNPKPGDYGDVYYCALAHCPDDDDQSCDKDDYVDGNDWAGTAAPAPWNLPQGCTCLVEGVRRWK